MRALTATVALLLGVGCQAGEARIAVDVRSDLEAGRDFASVLVERFEHVPGGRGRPLAQVERAVEPTDDWLRGQRVADLTVPTGEVWLRARMFDDRGVEVLERAVRVRVTGSISVVVPMTLACRGLRCDPSATCVEGACVAATCAGEGCGCVTAEDCAGGASCAAPECVAGACLPTPDDGSCGAGRRCDPVVGCVPSGCAPSCDGRACGDDGCGGSCGECAAPDTCVEGACTCVPRTGECSDDGCGGWLGDCPSGESTCDFDTRTCVPCTPSCEGRECGDDGCGGSCGSCEFGRCAGDECYCTPDCRSRECGGDGCGGSCGDCPAPETCSASGACECVPDCDGRNCGPDGCGGVCGACGPRSTCVDGRCAAG